MPQAGMSSSFRFPNEPSHSFSTSLTDVSTVILHVCLPTLWPCGLGILTRRSCNRSGLNRAFQGRPSSTVPPLGFACLAELQPRSSPGPVDPCYWERSQAPLCTGRAGQQQRHRRSMDATTAASTAATDDCSQQGRTITYEHFAPVAMHVRGTTRHCFRSGFRVGFWGTL